jgi:hypothetical protein
MKKSLCIPLALLLTSPAVFSQAPAGKASVPTSSAAQPKSGDIVAYTQFISSRRDPENLGDAVLAAMANPVIGPVLVVGSYYMGVPPEYVVSLAGAAASAQNEKANADRQVPRKGYHVYTLKPPQGYAMCAIRVGAISIHPTKRDRPKAVVSGSSNQVTVAVDHSTQSFGKGRSTVKLAFDVLAVKAESARTYEDKCLGKSTTTLIPLCRGSDCNPYVTRNSWLNGIDFTLTAGAQPIGTVRPSLLVEAS